MASRARPCAARTRLFGLIATPNGALRTPRPSQLRCSPKINKIYRTLSLAPRPPPPHRSFADPSGNIVGSKLCTGATTGPNFFRFFLFLYSFLIFSFCYSLLILLSFFNFFSFIYSYSCLLIGSYSSYSSRTILRLLIFFLIL